MTDGNLAAVAIALDMPVTEAYDWLFLKRQKAEAEMKWQAALHGVKLKSSNGTLIDAPQISPRRLMGLLGGNVEHVKVSAEEMERRRLRQAQAPKREPEK